MSRLTQDEDIPPEIYRTRTMRSLDNSAADFTSLTNDIFSYRCSVQKILSSIIG